MWTIEEIKLKLNGNSYKKFDKISQRVCSVCRYVTVIPYLKNCRRPRSLDKSITFPKPPTSMEPKMIMARLQAIMLSPWTTSAVMAAFRPP